MSGDDRPQASEFLEAMMNLAAVYSPVIDMVAGQRALMEQAGFSPPVAEMMAANLYSVVIRNAGTS